MVPGGNRQRIGPFDVRLEFAMTAAVGLDLGSTRIKAARLMDDGNLTGLVAYPAPALEGEDPYRQGDAEQYLAVAQKALEEVLCKCPSDTAVAIASQRSTFSIWERTTGRILSPMISWQDRRAQGWCRANALRYRELASKTGLPLSPHYAGPKLAQLLEENPQIKSRSQKGDILFGTLDSLLIWRLTQGASHLTDLTMAARTLMVDIHSGQWDNDLLQFFGIPGNMLPGIVPTAGHGIELTGAGKLAVTIADQAAGLRTSMYGASSALAVNLGTGGFVLAPAGLHPTHRKGYLTAPILQETGGTIHYALEGTINAIGPALVNYPGPDPDPCQTDDPAPDLFCLPDSAGIGAPYWLPDRSITFSRKVEGLSPAAVRHAIMEGIVFRVCQMVENFQTLQPYRQIIVSGGISNATFIPHALSVVTGLETATSHEPEATLWGAASLAARRQVHAPALKIHAWPSLQLTHLKGKYRRWKKWMAHILPAPSYKI